MSIQTELFDEWAGLVAPGETFRRLQQRAGIAETTFSTQRSNNRVPPSTVINIAEDLGLNSLKELSQFPGYESLYPIPAFSEIEIGCLINTVLITQAWATRSTNADYIAPENIGIDENALRRWFDLAAQGKKQKDCAEAVGLHPGNLSKYLSESTFPFTTMLQLCNYLGTPPHLPALICGWIPLSNLGLTGYGRLPLREDYVHKFLQDYLQTASLSSLRKVLEKNKKWWEKDFEVFSKNI